MRFQTSFLLTSIKSDQMEQLIRLAGDDPDDDELENVIDMGSIANEKLRKNKKLKPTSKCKKQSDNGVYMRQIKIFHMFFFTKILEMNG